MVHFFVLKPTTVLSANNKSIFYMKFSPTVALLSHFSFSLWAWAFPTVAAPVGGEVRGCRLYLFLRSFIRASCMKGFKSISLTPSLLSRKVNWKFSSHLLSLCSCEQQFYFFKINLDFLMCTTENQCSFFVPKVHPAIKDVLKTSSCVSYLRKLCIKYYFWIQNRFFVDCWRDFFFLFLSVLQIFSFLIIIYKALFWYYTM